MEESQQEQIEEKPFKERIFQGARVVAMFVGDELGFSTAEKSAFALGYLHGAFSNPQLKKK